MNPTYDALVEEMQFDPRDLPERTHESFMARQRATWDKASQPKRKPKKKVTNGRRS